MSLKKIQNENRKKDDIRRIEKRPIEIKNEDEML